MEIREKINKISQIIPDYLLLICSLIMIFGAGIYYLYALNWGSIIVILALVITSFFGLYKYLFTKANKLEDDTNIKENTKKETKKLSQKILKYWPFLVYAALCLCAFYILHINQSDRALISPWQVINYKFFISYALSSLLLVFILLKNKFTATSKLIALSVYYFLSFSVAAIVYKIGYGFDPFVHQATMELIDKKGLVLPKPFYYLGEYSLIIILHKLSGLSIYVLNKFLVSVLAAIFLPLATHRLARQNSFNYGHWLTPLFLLILGFSPFIMTTPQNLSYLFLILTIIFGLTKKSPLWSLILAGATLAIHPLTGIPALCWWLVLILNKQTKKIKRKTYKLLKTLLFIFSALMLPLALFIAGGSNLKRFNWDFYSIISPVNNLFSTLSSAGQENWLLNFVYFFTDNYNLWLILIIIGSLIAFYHQKKHQNLKSLIFINAALVLAYLISSQIVFNDLINYEQANFASRLLILIMIFFLPFIISELQNLITRIFAQDKLSRIIWLIIGLALLMSSLYVSYPRFDKYFNSRGYSTSANDLAAVNLIAQTTSQPYIVLADQQVSVAALYDLGFDHYFPSASGLLYFYPIPTGGQLYQYYLDMVYKNPSQETMAAARNLVGVKESYLIVNTYWFQSDRVISAAKLSANSWKTINNEVYIFKYLP